MAVKLVESLKKGLSILQTFSPEEPSLKLQEIAQKTGIPKATAYRLLQTLISLNFVRYDSETTTFQPGPEVLSLGFTVLAGLDVREIALPYLEELSQRIDQNVNLGVLQGRHVVYVARVKRRKILNIELAVGSRLNAHDSSIGQAILAFLDEPRLEQIIAQLVQEPAYTQRIGEQAQILRDELAQVREQGFALNDEELVLGLRAVGAPVFNAQGEVEAAVNMAVFSQMCSREELLNKYTPLLMETAGKISRDRGYRG